MNQDNDTTGSRSLIAISDPAELFSRLAAGKRTVVLFEMTGCPYCVACKSRFADLVRERPDLDFVRVLLDDPRHPLWQQYDILAVPTAIAFERGEIVARADAILALGLFKKRWLDFLAQL